MAKQKPRYGEMQIRVWKYLIENRTAKPAEVARATGASYNYVWTLMKKIGTPPEVFEAEADAPIARLHVMIKELEEDLARCKNIMRTVFGLFVVACAAFIWMATGG